MKGFYIQVTNNLLEPKHVKKIGAAIWEYMWCLDKMTSVNEFGVGKVLGGKPVKWEEIREDLGKHLSTIGDNMSHLQKGGYIHMRRTPYGHVVSVNKAKKPFKQTRENTRSDKGKHPIWIGKTPDLTRENTRYKEDVFSIDPTVDSTEDTTRLASLREAREGKEIRGPVRLSDLLKKYPK